MLNPTWKKLLLGLHILFVGIWIGSLAIIILIILTGDLLVNQSTVVAVSKVIFTINDYAIMNIAAVVGVTGLLFSTFTQWGFVKHWWIILKWILLITLAVFLIFWFTPIVNSLAGISNVLGKDVTFSAEYLKLQQTLLFYCVTQLTVLAVIVFISVFKPWGKRHVKRNFNRKVVVPIVVITTVILLAAGALHYNNLLTFREIKIGEIDLNEIENGIYPGEADLGFVYKVNVIVQNNKITDIEFVQNRTGIYAKLAEKIKRKIIRQQKIDVDAVTGATTTSKALLKAIDNAFKADTE